MNMKCFYILFVILLAAVSEYLATQYRQEGAVVKKCNNKYMKNCYAITRRLKRGEPYLTNFTGTILHTWMNNVTVKVNMQSEGYAAEIPVIKAPICDALQVKWLHEYLKKYSNVDQCPFKAGNYKFMNLEFPPKNFPMDLMKFIRGKFITNFYFLLTETEEIILESTLTLYL